MFIEALVNFSTARGGYIKGQIYEVSDWDGDVWCMAGHAKCTTANPPHIVNFLERLDAGKGRPCIFLPHLGEFGHQIMTGLRLVHWNTASEKIVCCKPCEKVLYPSAAGFVTDWKMPAFVKDEETAGSMQSPAAFWPDITARYPNHLPIEQGGLTAGQELLTVHIDERIPFRPRCRGLRPEVLLGVRYRDFHHEKNYPHWNAIAAGLRAEGIRFAVVGGRAGSLHLDGEEWHSGDLDTDAAIEGIQNCRLWVSTDTGSAHLASTVGCNMIVIREPFFGRDFIPRMAAANFGYQTQRLEGAWDEPAAVIKAIVEALEAVAA